MTITVTYPFWADIHHWPEAERAAYVEKYLRGVERREYADRVAQAYRDARMFMPLDHWMRVYKTGQRDRLVP